MERKINRKKFLKASALTAGILSIVGVFKLFKDDIFKAKKLPSKDLSNSIKKGVIQINKKKTSVSISAVEKSIEDAVKNAALSATDFSWLKKGHTVFIKPVINSGNPYPATTHPLAIATMIKLLKIKGAKRVIVGDMSGIEHLKFFKNKTEGSTKELMKRSGIYKAIIDAGGEPYFFEEGGWDAFYIDQTEPIGLFKNGLMMPKILQEVDHIVLMPRCSRHVLAGASLGLKAVVGYWRTDSRLEYHYNGHQLHERTAEGNRSKTLLDKQRLVISTGDKLLATFGPDNGYVYSPNQGIIIASESVVAHDMVSLAWLLLNRKLLPEKNQNDFKDNSTGVAKGANTFVVKMLSNWPKAFMSKPLLKNDLKSIWDDRTLNHSYKVFGGIPNIILKNVKNRGQKKNIKKLENMTQHPSA